MPLSAQDESLLEFARHVTQRWGVDVPKEPRDVQNAIKVALRQAVANAQKTPFRPVYADDHMWTATGLRGLTVARLKEDEASLSVDVGEEWAVVAMVTGFDAGFLVPLVLDVDEDMARALVGVIDSSKSDFLDLDDASQVLLTAGGGVDNDEEEIKVQIIAASWGELRDISFECCLPLSDAVFFRRPVAWDLLRARISGAGCPPLPKFDEDGFFRRRDLSVRFDRIGSAATLERLSQAIIQSPDLNTPKGRNWFNLICDGLNALGLGHPLSGLSVLIHFSVEKRVEDGLSDDLPDVFKSWEGAGLRCLCIGYGLDPLQASFLLDLAQVQSEDFHLLEGDARKLFVPVGVSVVPDMHLSSMRATIVGRCPEAYDALVKATARPAQITGIAA